MSNTKYFVTDDQLAAVADAIRAKSGTSAPLTWPDGFSAAVAAIPIGGVWPHYYGLPEGYTEADYLRLQGTELVVPASPLAGDDVIVTCHFRYSGRRSYAGVYRQYTNENTNCVRLIQTADVVADNTFYLNNNTRAAAPTTVTASQNEWHMLQSSRSYVMIDGTRTPVRSGSGNVNTATDIYIGNNIPTVTTDYKRLDISKGDDAFRSLVPCTDPNGIPGLFDLVTGVFYAPTDATKATAADEYPAV